MSGMTEVERLWNERVPLHETGRLEHLVQLCDRWGIDLGQNPQSIGHTSFVLPGLQRDSGRKVIAKHSALAEVLGNYWEPFVLSLWSEHGIAPRVLHVDQDNPTYFATEKVDGNPYHPTTETAEQVRVQIERLSNAIHIPLDSAFMDHQKSTSRMVMDLALGQGDGILPAGAVIPDLKTDKDNALERLDWTIARAKDANDEYSLDCALSAKGLLDEMGDGHYLLHGDFQGKNILATTSANGNSDPQQSKLSVIDPMPCIGHIESDLALFIVTNRGDLGIWDLEEEFASNIPSVDRKLLSYWIYIYRACERMTDDELLSRRMTEYLFVTAVTTKPVYDEILRGAIQYWQ